MNSFLKFLLIGVISNIINFAIYSSLFVLNFAIYYCATFGYISGLTSSFIGNKFFTFHSDKPTSILEVTKFIFIYILGGLIMVFIISFLTNYIDYRLAWLFGAILAIMNNYLGIKFFVFNN